MDAIITKKCSKCNIVKNIDEYYTIKGGYGRNIYPDCACKKCRIIAAKKYYKTVKPERRRELYRKNSAVFLSRKREDRQKNLEKDLCRGIKARAKFKGIEFDLVPEDIEIPNRCPYLGIEIVTTNTKISDNSPSVDRIDPTKGYTVDNVQVISLLANRMKNSANETQLKTFAKNVLRIHA